MLCIPSLLKILMARKELSCPDCLMSKLGAFSTSPTVCMYCVFMDRHSLCILALHVFLYMYVWSRNKKPSATSWLGLQLREFGHCAMKTCQTCRKRRSHGQATSHTTVLAKSLSITGNNHSCGCIRHVCQHSKYIHTVGVLMIQMSQLLGLGVLKHADLLYM